MALGIVYHEKESFVITNIDNPYYLFDGNNNCSNIFSEIFNTSDYYDISGKAFNWYKSLFMVKKNQQVFKKNGKKDC